MSEPRRANHGPGASDPTAESDTATDADVEPDSAIEPSTSASTDATALDGATAHGPDDGTRWDRFSPAPEHVPGRAGRAARRVGGVLVHEWTLVCLGAVLLAVVMTWPGALHPATTIPSDIWDPTLEAWMMSWGGHALLTDPTQLWNANAFYPDAYSYTFSDTLFGYFPAALIGTGPTAALIRYNIIFILVEALAFIGAYALVRQLGARRIAAAVAGAAFAYAPWRWGQAGHLHVLSVGGVALSFAMLARGHGFSFTRGYDRERVRPGWALAGWCTAAWQLTIGFGIGLPFAYVLGGVCLVAIVRWLIKGRPALGRRLLVFDGIGVLIFAAVGVFMGLPYLEVIKLHPEAVRDVSQLSLYSPSLRGFFTAPPQSLPWGDAHEAARATMTAPAEMALLPGFMLYGLAAAGLFFSVWRLRTRLWLLAGVVVSIVLGMGTQFWGGGKYTYIVLYDYLPAFSSSRTPGRLVVWTTLLLGLLAAGAVGALVDRSHVVTADRVPYRPSLAMRLASVLPLLLVLAEGTNWGKLDHPVVPPQPAAMRTVDGPMLVLPSDVMTDNNIMLWSTTKFQKMVNGNSGFWPSNQAAIRQATKSFPDPTSIDYLRRLGIRNVVVIKNRIGGTDYEHSADLTIPLEGLGVTRQDEGDTIVYTIN